MVQNNVDIKLIALDIDGTLLNSKHEITDANRQAIKEAESMGVKVVLSTGRSLLTCGQHAKSLELKSYLVTVNGSEIWGPDGELVHRSIVENEHMKWMLELSKTHKTRFWAISCDNVWNNEMPENLDNHQWLKFGFDIDDDQVREIIKKELEEKGIFELSNSSLTNIEVNPTGINKAKGIEKVCDLLGIKMEQVMACGDSLNDIKMIQEVGLGVAMGNAQEKVKEVADWVTETNDRDGVAVAIKKWVLS